MSPQIRSLQVDECVASFPPCGGSSPNGPDGGLAATEHHSVWLRSAVFIRDSSARKNRTDCRWLRFVEYTQRLSARKSGTDFHGSVWSVSNHDHQPAKPAQLIVGFVSQNGCPSQSTADHAQLAVGFVWSISNDDHRPAKPTKLVVGFVWRI